MGKTPNLGLRVNGPSGFSPDAIQDGGSTWDCDYNMYLIDAALASGTDGFTPPPTKVVYVDVSRSDSYMADGSLLKPFKTIMAAVGQIVYNGDNSTKGYVVWVNPGTYAETIDLSNPALINLTFVGYGAIVNTQGIGFTDALRIVGNDNLTDLKMIGFKFLGGSTNGLGITVSSSTNGTSLLNGNVYSWGLWLKDCDVLTANFTMTNAGGAFLDGCSLTSKTTFNNVNQIEVRTCTINTSGSAGWNVNTNSGNPGPAGFSSTAILARYNLFSENLTISAGSVANLYWNRMVQTTTVNGSVVAFFCAITSVVINSGGSFSERSSTHSTLTVNGGTYSSVTYTEATGGLTLSGPAPTTPAGVLGLGNGTASSATAGSDTLPANPAGFLVANLGGTAIKIPYYNS